MWWGPGADPGGSEGEGPSKDPQTQKLLDLQEQFDQQQTLMAQLKEMLRKTEQSSTVNREKVEEYASTLNKLNARAKKSKIKKGDDGDTKTESPGDSVKKPEVMTPAKEKIFLLRQQLEENKVKLAQRDKNQKGIEEMVNQLKAQFDDSQSMINDPSTTTKPESLPEPITYTIETSKEELVNIINLKDRSIEELTSKLQQMEASVLDLQENVKEKDSVIDARTKAITLLSENLSKKGKNTLDMLDETKEQMRSMQENFISLEAKMKEENNKLEVELGMKNIQIHELVNDNNNLKRECNVLSAANNEAQLSIDNLNIEVINYKMQLSDFETQIKDLTTSNNYLQNRIAELQSSEAKSEEKGAKPKRNRNKSKSKERSETQIYQDRIAELEQTVKELSAATPETGDEVTKLKKQLEEMNKNMIKMKAQHKSKLKDVQKKSGAGDEERVAGLEAEIAKLNQCVLELEEEKGNLQLRLVEVESNKDKEHIEDLENKIEEQRMQIENHIRTITSLETQISTSSNEISSLKSELANFVHLENAQVCSEITSVQLEEQLDKEVLQNKELHDLYNLIVREKEELLQKMDGLVKEKQELSTKLESYMQENMELIDRLEKLSAEKVSSAESIEIVESLTQQEKLEIEAYQKNLEHFDKSEISELDQNTDLNESVTKLKEETSELMEKIELFTAERREVMEKMDLLATENQQLVGHLGEEKDSVKLLKEEKECLEAKLHEAMAETSDLTEKLKLLSGGKDKLETELNECKIIIENHARNADSLRELESARHQIDDLNDRISQLTSELEQKNEINDRNDSTIQILEAQLAEVKSMMTENINDLQTYELEMQNNSKTIEQLNDQLNEMNYKIVETEHIIELKNQELAELNAEKSSLTDKVASLETELADRDKIGEACDALKEKCRALESQIEVNAGSLEDIKGPFETKIRDLERKNKEQVEKMKKIAANLKKKALMCQELEAKLKDVMEGREKEEQNRRIHDLESEKLMLETKYNEKQTECEQVRLNVDNQTQKIQELIAENNMFVDKLTALNNDLQAIKINYENEVLLSDGKDALVEQLREQIQTMEGSFSISSNALNAKLQETFMLVENLESENAGFKDQISRLEEKFMTVEKRKEYLEQRMLELDAQLEAKHFKCEEALQLEDALENRLSALLAHNGTLETKIQELTSSNEQLQSGIRSSTADLEHLQAKLHEKDALLREMKDNSERLVSVENENIQLSDTVSHLEAQLRRLQLQYDKMLTEKTTEIENMEVELNGQLQELSLERKNLLVRCEMFEDNINEYIENEQTQTEEIERLRQQTSIMKIDLSKQLADNQSLVVELDALKSQIDDVTKLKLEISSLQQALNSKDMEIQRQNAQLIVCEPVPIKIFQASHTAARIEDEQVDEHEHLLETARQQVDEIITKAEEIVSRTPPNNNAELLKKIKALEFMLYNVEREKDDAVSQCHGLSNELTRLIYERQKHSAKAPARTADLHALEAEIVSGEDRDVTDMKHLEFTATSEGPEEVIQAKSAYKCYGNEPSTSKSGDGEDHKSRESSEGQLAHISPEEFGALEHVREPKHANLCFPEDGPDIVLQDTFASEEDGWGWNAEEARLEEEHRQRLSAHDGQSRIVQLEGRIGELEAEKTRLSEEVKGTQLRYAKLMKKFKDLKLKNDALSKKSGEFDDLDMAIQDELNIQIRNLEQRVKELSDERAKDGAEHANMLQRLDVLTAANERMIEMKEKQDNEIQMWQYRNRELSSKIEQLEWGDDFREQKKPIETETDDEQLHKKIEELTAAVNDLTVDNEEMQCMLEEQRNLRLEAEKALANTIQRLESEKVDQQTEIKELQNKWNTCIKNNEEISNKNSEYESDLQKLKAAHSAAEEHHKLKIKELFDINEKLQLDISRINVENENIISAKYESDIGRLNNELALCNIKIQELLIQNDDLKGSLNNLMTQLEDRTQQISGLRSLNDQLIAEKEALYADTLKQIEDLQVQLAEATQQLSSLEVAKRDLETALMERSKAADLLSTTVQQLSLEKNELQGRIQELVNIDNPLQQLNERITAMTAELEEKSRELNVLNHAIVSERNEFEQKLSVTVEQLAKEWADKVEQRGNDVAESWKLHVDTRENEFMNIEQRLKLELTELYNTNEKLLTDNKELQLKVEAFLAEKKSDTSDKTICDLQEAVDEKQKEIVLLSQKLHDVSAQLQERNEEISNLKQSFDQTKNIEIAKMKNNLLEVEERYEEMLSTKDSDIENLRVQLEMKTENCNNLEAKLNEANALSDEESRQLFELRKYVDEQSSKIHQLNQQLTEKTDSVEQLSNDLKIAKHSMEALNQNIATHDNSVAEIQTLNQQIADLHLQISEKSSAYDATLSEYENAKQTILQLNQQLFETTSNYNSLVSEYESIRHSHRHELSTPIHEKRVTFREPIESNIERIHEPPVQPAKKVVDDVSDPVSRAELDIALYMLHQRDVRCEELTVELMQLLEERDTLQLRLSNAIRINEELKGKNEAGSPEKSSPKRSTGAIPKSKASAIVLGAMGTELASEAVELSPSQNEDKEKLANKISELHSIGYRDKTLKEDQEARHLQQMSVMQQHIDLASRLPPEAAARLMDANYTLSRDVQSPSKVLLNWLWGRSTPKVNDV